MKPTNKKITVNIPISLYDEVEKLNIDITKTVICALERCIKKEYTDFELEKGYKEMGEINLELAAMCLEADNDALETGEQYLTECE